MKRKENARSLILCPKGYQAKPGGFLRTASDSQKSENKGVPGKARWILCPKGYQAKPGGFLRTASEFQQSEYQGYQANPTIPNNNRINTNQFLMG